MIDNLARDEGGPMKGQHLAFVAILVLLASSTWGQNTTPEISYTQKEYTGSLGCVGLTDTAWKSASQKLAGVRIDDAKKIYDGRLEGALKTLNLHIVDKVYGDTFTNAWDYAVSFYGECAQNVADVGKDRSGLANYCMQNSIISMAAWEYRNAGEPVENVYQYFGKFSEVPTARSIIDRVYAGSKSRPNTALDVWQSCAKPLVSQTSSAPPPAVQSIPPLGGLTDNEFAAMKPCVALGVIVWGIAENKLKGARPEDVKKQYDTEADASKKAFVFKIVDKVYAEDFVAPGLYATRYLDSCARTKGVAPERMGVGNSCLTNAHIAARVGALKKSGASAQKAYEPFAEFDGTAASSIVEKVYHNSDFSENPGEVEWRACVISSPTWTTNEKGLEVVIAATPSGYQIGDQEKTEEIVFQRFYPKGESFKHWTEQLNLSAFPGLIDRTPTAFQKAVQGPSTNCVDGKVISSSIGQEDGYAFALWYETCGGSPDGKLEFRFNKVIQGHENLYAITKYFKFEPTDAQAQQWRSYLGSVKVCDSKRSGQPCPTTDAWHP
jgi:hypothetical protein